MLALSYKMLQSQLAQSHLPLRKSTQARRSMNTRTHAASQLHTGLQSVLAQHPYKALLLDQYGVLHDGKNASPEAISACELASKQGLALFIISNSSRRASGTIDKLRSMGFTCDFAGAVTSGELTHQALEKRQDEWWQNLSSRCLHFTWSSRGSVSLDGLGLEVVDDPHKASFLLAHGTEAVSLPAADGSVVERSLDELTSLLGQCAALDPPPVMIVANPDMVTTSGRDLIPMPGTLAKRYRDMNPKCVTRLMGKPDPIIYDACAAALGGIQPSEILAVGDSLEHDIAGASAAGIDSLFISSGIHRQEVCKSEGVVDMEALEALCAHHGGCRPKYVLPQLQW